ncbi:MAG TPA: hypothetical protein VGQ09_10370 [Chitinophagaceae bacterium]|jgi:hypothetical protein|nr:hypothetical protein [Chitinophagaceae bacterium]
MKKNLLFFIALTIGLNLFSQPVIKIFGFEQESLPGTIPVGVKDENGNPVKKAATPKNYFIFLSFKKKYSVTPIQMFIRGKAFTIQSTSIEKTPVAYINNTIHDNAEKTILVPQTSDKVIKLQIIETPKQEKKTAYIQNLTGKNDLVIAYLWNKKKYFITLKKLKKLDPVANE